MTQGKVLPNHQILVANPLLITTPEGIILTLTPAGPGLRFLALGLDFGLILIITKILSLLSKLLAIIDPEFTLTFIFLLQLVVSWAYYSAFEWFNRGQSPGKKLFGLRVVDKDGFQLQPSQIIIRNLFRIIDSLPVFYLLGGCVSMFSPLYQRVGDLIASTVVIYDRRSLPPNIEHITPERFNSFYDYPHLVLKARQKITPFESSLILKALLRRDQLIPEARIDLYHELTCYFRTIVNFPIENISDEQYLRNLLGVLYSWKRQAYTNSTTTG